MLGQGLYFQPVVIQESQQITASFDCSGSECITGNKTCVQREGEVMIEVVMLCKMVRLSTFERGFDWHKHNFSVSLQQFQKRNMINHIIKAFNAMESWNKHNTHQSFYVNK